MVFGESTMNRGGWVTIEPKMKGWGLNDGRMRADVKEQDFQLICLYSCR